MPLKPSHAGLGSSSSEDCDRIKSDSTNEVTGKKEGIEFPVNAGGSFYLNSYLLLVPEDQLGNFQTLPGLQIAWP